MSVMSGRPVMTKQGHCQLCKRVANDLVETDAAWVDWLVPDHPLYGARVICLDCAETHDYVRCEDHCGLYAFNGLVTWALSLRIGRKVCERCALRYERMIDAGAL